MKKVFSNNELPHIWARQTQNEGRGSAMFFNGTKIYSYGYHFCMANIIKPGIVLFTDRTYSNSTAKHLNHTRGAVNHMEVITVPYPENDDLQKNLEAWKSRIQEQIEIIENKRKKPETHERAKGELSSLVKSIERFFEVTEQTISKKLPGTSAENTRKEFLLHFEVAKNLQALPELKKKLERKAKADERALKIRNAKAIEEAKEKLLQWRKGARVYIHSSYGLPVYLRAIKTHKSDQPGSLVDTIETSIGARVKYESGKLLYKLIQAGKDIKGHDIDGYTVISVNGSLKIGCHEIDMKEVRRFAKSQGWV
jgi:hypothetical protein